MRLSFGRIKVHSAKMPSASSKPTGTRAPSTKTAAGSSSTLGVDVSTPSGLASALADSGALPNLVVGPSSSKSLRERPIQSLWAGYGTINELELELEGEGERGKKRNSTFVIVKRVRPPRGDAGDLGHQRKLDSYVCEAAFYQHCAQRTIEGGAAIARPLLVSTSERSPNDDRQRGNSSPFSLTLVLSDLRPTHPNFARGGLRPEQLRACLRWLARFHAIWWGVEAQAGVQPRLDGVPGGVADRGGGESGSFPPRRRGENEGDENGNDGDAPLLPKELADREGTFWHLDTRPEELEAIPEDGGFLSDLKKEARGIAEDLKREIEKFPTLNHGDAKAANFCWSSPNSNSSSSPSPPSPSSSSPSSPSPIVAAAYDFQYVGRGVGARDVAYLLSSAGSSSDDGQLESSLDFYFRCLQEDLRSLGKGEEAKRFTRETLDSHFRLSSADFVRFMAGWGSWGGGAARAEKIARELVEERRKRR